MVCRNFILSHHGGFLVFYRTRVISFGVSTTLGFSPVLGTGSQVVTFHFTNIINCFKRDHLRTGTVCLMKIPSRYTYRDIFEEARWRILGLEAELARL